MNRLRDFWYILLRNVFLLINGIIFSVVVLLFVFGDIREGIFLGVIAVLNVAFGLFQDTRAWLALEKLQLLTAPRVQRVREDGSEESVLTEAIQKDDRLKVKIGDQIPCDSELLDSHGLEINEGLITGESNSAQKKLGDILLAGSVVTAGAGVVKVKTVFRESRIARMTEGIQKYSVDVSPLQASVNVFVRWMGYILAVVLVFVIGRGLLLHEPAVHLVLQVGALSNMLVPQGLVFIVTLFFSYGAAYLFKRHVLLQEVNATEKLGRIKTLCMDKTGTLTENVLTVEHMLVFEEHGEDEVKVLMAAYIHGSGESSQIIQAVQAFIGQQVHRDIREAQAFSSWRQYGAVSTVHHNHEAVVLAGAADTFLPHLPPEQQEWLTAATSGHSKQGKKLLCVVRSLRPGLPTDLATAQLAVLAAFVFHNNLREGIQETVHFFQNRGVSIRIISGDTAQTVVAVATAADIHGADRVITGPELRGWSASDYQQRVPAYTIFAGVTPEQKESIIEAFKHDGFTAMVGDGANDALAIKKADLGIAMFDGASATRQLASVVLTNNSFTALPGGVALADSIIGNLELYASLFMNQTLIGLLLFISTALLGQSYPLSPFNITFINYFTFGLPGALVIYWAVRPAVRVPAVNARSFLQRTLPFAAASSVLQVVVLTILFFLNSALLLPGFIVCGLVFFMVAPSVYVVPLVSTQKKQVLLGCLVGALLFLAAFHIPFITSFFNLTWPILSVASGAAALAFLVAYTFGQLLLGRWFSSPKTK